MHILSSFYLKFSFVFFIILFNLFIAELFIYIHDSPEVGMEVMEPIAKAGLLLHRPPRVGPVAVSLRARMPEASFAILHT
jgi:hypothetical protein